MEIIIENGSSCEFVASQLQKLLRATILCVKDGHMFLVYDSEADIPKTLKFVEKRHNELVDTFEYHYRDSTDDSLYVFFKPLMLSATIKIARKVAGLTVSVDNDSPLDLNIGDRIDCSVDERSTEDVEKIIVIQ
jgi:hypothetical protein